MSGATGLTLAIIRIEKGISRSKFCTIYKYDHSNVARNERGTNEIRICALANLLNDCYGMSIMDFFALQERILAIFKDDLLLDLRSTDGLPQVVTFIKKHRDKLSGILDN